MKTLCLILLVLFCQTGHAITAAKKHAIIELIEVSLLHDMVEPKVYSAIKNKNRDADGSEVTAKVRQRMDEAFYSDAIETFDEIFSEEELDATLAYYKSDLNKKWKMAMGQTFAVLLFDRLTPLIDEILETYPEAAEKEIDQIVMENVPELTEGKFEAEVIQSSLPVVLDFYGHSCPPCKRLAPILDDLSKQLQGRVKFFKAERNNCLALATKFKVEFVPTLLFFKEGKLVGKHVGYADKETLSAKLKDLFSESA